MEFHFLAKVFPESGSVILEQIFSAKVVRLVSRELKGTVTALATLTVVRSPTGRGRSSHTMLAMNSFQSRLLGNDSSNSSPIDSCQRIRACDDENAQAKSNCAIQLLVNGQHERCLSSPKANATEDVIFSEQLEYSTEELDLAEELHKTLDSDRDVLERTACQTAACRAHWIHVIHDPLAEILAGRAFMQIIGEKLKKDQASRSRELAGVMLAVRTLWFDSLLENAIRRLSPQPQVVLLGAGMDARVYRLNSLKGCSVFEVDFPKLLNLKGSILDIAQKAERGRPSLHAQSVERVAADVSHRDWLQQLEQAGFNPRLHTVWILEGLLYYLKEADAKSVLEAISANSKCDSVLLADFMNESSTLMGRDLKTKFYFHSDWPEELLPHLGYCNVNVSQIGDKDANFGLVQDELHIFNKIRSVPRHVTSDDAGKPCPRLLLVEGTVAKHACVELAAQAYI